MSIDHITEFCIDGGLEKHVNRLHYRTCIDRGLEIHVNGLHDRTCIDGGL